MPFSDFEQFFLEDADFLQQSGRQSQNYDMPSSSKVIDLDTENNWDALFSVSGQKASMPGPARKNGKSSGFLPHKQHCPNENAAFSQVRELFPEVNEVLMWNLFEKFEGNSELTVSAIIDQGITDQGSSDKLYCFCFEDLDYSSQCLVSEQDEAFARALHEQEVEAAANQKRATEMQATKKRLVQQFPEFDEEILSEIFKSTGYDYKKTVELVKDSAFGSAEESNKVEGAQKKASKSKLKRKRVENNNVDSRDEQKKVQDLRNEIAKTYEEIKANKIKAQEAIQAKDYEAATRFSNIVQSFEVQRDECAMKMVNLMASIHENAEGSTDEIDLHYLKPIEARVALDRFLDENIATLTINQQSYKVLCVITGRGVHSSKGVSIIKENTLKQLKERKLRSKMINPGRFEVRVFKDSPFSHDVGH